MANFRIYFRYDNQKRDLLLNDDLKKKYYGVIIPCTTALYFQNSVISFLDRYTKPYIIDPMTFFLNQPPKNITKRITGSIRRSYKKIIEVFLNLNEVQIQEYIDNEREFIQTDINEEELKVIVSRIIDFQRNFGQTEDMRDFLDLYEDILGKSKELKSPEFLIPPYFRIKKGNATYDLNKKSIEIANNNLKEGDPPLCGCFTLNKSFINQKPNIAQKILEDFPFLKNFMIWISDFNACKESVENLNKIKNIVKTLSNEGNNCVINLYGDYFSFLLSKFGLSGVNSGIGTSTKKSAILSRGAGGGTTIKIYVPNINKGLLKDDFKRLLDTNPDIVCNCPKCEEIIGGLNRDAPNFLDNYYNLLLSNNNYDKHYIYSRVREKEFIESSDLEGLVKNLEEKHSTFSTSPYALHLKNWKDDI